MSILNIALSTTNPDNILEDQLDSITTIWDKVVDWFNGVLLPYLPQLLIAVIVFLIGWFTVNAVSKMIAGLIKKFKFEPSVRSFIYSFINISLKVLVFITFLALLGINITAIITAMGAAGVAVALALQNNLSNVASGLIILVTRPFKVGDFVEYEGVSGTVNDIQLMFTHLNTIDNKVIVIPNSNLTANKLINYSTEDNRRVDLNISISYDNDFEKAKEIIRAVVDGCDQVLGDPPAIIRLGEHGESALVIHVRAWCLSEKYWDVYYDLTEGIKHAFDQNGIVIPYNQIDVHIDKQDSQE